VRIVSLLPSATEIVYALGLEDELVGVTHECDWPPEARAKRAVSFSALAPGTTPAEVDRRVSASIGGGDPIYRLDGEAVRELRPDMVLTQDLCAVCAVPSGHVNQALEMLGCTAEVVSLDPSSLDEVIECLVTVGRATGTYGRALHLAAELRRRLDDVRGVVAGRPRPRTLALEWSDPPFNGGHWVPEMIEMAGGEAVLGCPHTPSVRVEWEAIAEAAAEVVVFMPCGYDLEQAAEEGKGLLDRPELASAAAVFAVDASSFFSRPGPRLVDGVEALASVLHPDAGLPSMSQVVRRLR
jgi:iron complex transport system substrate-binding protein